MKNNKGFTIIELLAIILIFGIVMAIAVPTVNSYIKSSKEKSYNTMLENLQTAASSYISEYPDWIGTGATSTMTITIRNLIDYGFITASETLNKVGILKDPRTDKNITDCIVVKATKNNTTFKITYEVINSC